MLRWLLIAFLIYLAYRWVILPLLRGWAEGGKKKNAHRANSPDREAGKKRNDRDDGGEYIDYEEIK